MGDVGGWKEGREWQWDGEEAGDGGSRIAWLDPVTSVNADLQ